MSWFWKGLFLGHILTSHRGRQPEPRGPSVMDPEETYRCGHCNAEVHPDDKWCRNCDGILTDKHKMVEITYTRGQIWGPVVVFVILVIVILIGLKAVCG